MANVRRTTTDLVSSPSIFHRLHYLASQLQRLKHTSSDDSRITPLKDETSVSTSTKSESTSFKDEPSVSTFGKGSLDTSAWKTLDSRSLGIRKSDISPSAWRVLNLLHRKGFEAYVVGGCVRDLIMKRPPKDFDVVTSATLKQVEKLFYRCRVVGRQFPICHVNIFGCVIEVSSFETTHRDAKKRQAINLSKPSNCNKKDFMRWKDSIRRDFTINGLFYDPFVCTIYDYVNGIRDIKASKVRTVIPAHLSFKEDSARILRGLRIAARLSLTFSKDTNAAIKDLSLSIMTLDKQRLMMELNYMLAYGAAESSLCLLQRYKLLEVFFPMHAAYLTDQTMNQSRGSSIMLLKLFANVDKLLAADRPSSSSLWLGLLAFHQTLVEHPQDALVVWTFSSMFYLGTWKEAVEFVRSRVKSHVRFFPEILETSETKSEKSLMKETSHLASLIKTSVSYFISSEALQQALARCQMPLLSGLGHKVFVSEKMQKTVARLFDVDIKSYKKKRKTCDINYEELQKGDLDETRFVLGKIIMNTMSGELCQQDQHAVVDLLNGGFIGQQNENTVVEKVNDELSCQQNKNEVVDKVNGEPICQQNQNAVMDMVTGELICQRNENAVVDKLTGELICEQSQNAVVDKVNGELICQLNQHAVVNNMNGELSCEQNQGTVVDKVKSELIHQQNNHGAAAKKNRPRLSDLFK